AERTVLERRQIADGVGFRDVEATSAAGLRHFVIEIDAPGRDVTTSEQIQEFTAAAADIQHRRSSLEKRHVRLESPADCLSRTAKLILEAQVLGRVQGG